MAIKVFFAEAAAALGADRFAREIRTVARLQHPNILPLFDSGEHDGTLFFVMPFVDGGSLRELMTREAPRTPASVKMDSRSRPSREPTGAEGPIITSWSTTETLTSFAIHQRWRTSWHAQRRVSRCPLPWGPVASPSLSLTCRECRRAPSPRVG